MAFNLIYEKWDAADIRAMHAKGLFIGDPNYYINDIGTYVLTAEWENLAAAVLAGDAARPDSTVTAGISQKTADSRYVRKGQPVTIKGLG